MRIAYLILAHTGPAQVERLVKAIQSPSADVFIHVDAKSNMAQFERLAGDGVHILTERCAVYWGDFSQVEAILLLMGVALTAKSAYTRLVLLSGADYPIRSTEYIQDFLRRQPSIEFINIVDIPNDVAGKPLSRVDNFRPCRRYYFRSRVETKLRQAAVRLGLLKVERDHRPHLKGINPCGGSTWWALTRAACEYVLEYVDNHPAFVRFYANTDYPDELMIHTILGNSNFRSFVRHNLSYADWRGGGSNPAFLEARHAHEFEAVEQVMADDAYGKSELLFARKLGNDAGALTSAIDGMRARKSHSVKV